MPSLTPYIPTKQALLKIWADNFAALITSSPTTYGLQLGDASAIQTVVTAFDTALTNATTPTTKSPVTVALKNAAKATMLGVVRSYAQTVAKNAGISAGTKTALGINPGTSVPAPIPTPVTNPVLTFVSKANSKLILKYADSVNGATSKAKPYGVIGIQVGVNIGATDLGTTDTMIVEKLVTKSPFTLDLAGNTATNVASIAARYYTRTGKVSAWSPVIYEVIG